MTESRPIEIRVNGIAVGAVRLRHYPEAPEQFDVLITDPQIGTFALHRGFDLELRIEGSDWHPTTLSELKAVLAQDREVLRAAEVQGTSKTVKRRVPNRATHLPTIGTEGEHVMSAETALFRAGIAFLQLPFQKDRFASSVFMVASVIDARACLCRAGFQPKWDSETVLFDSRSGEPIQLIEGKCKQ
jgi:hypothetical protein